MIVIDTSALMAILLDEPEAAGCVAVLDREEEFLMSAGTLAEALIVAGRRRIGLDMSQLIENLDVQVIDVTATSARKAAEAYARWGKGVHPARLNLGDCFAYALAKERNWPLLFVGDDFSQTDIASAL